jgi:hypothetical protein
MAGYKCRSAATSRNIQYAIFNIQYSTAHPRQNDFDAPVLAPAFFRIVCRHGPIEAVSSGRKSFRLNPGSFLQKSDHR